MDGRTDRRTDRWTENTIHLAAWSQLKIRKICEKLKFYNLIKNLTSDTPFNGSDYLWQIWK